MRKRNCDKLFDNILWYTIYLLPIIITICIIATNFSGDWYATWENANGDPSALPSFTVFYNVMARYDFVTFDVVYDSFSSVCELIGFLDGEFSYPIILYLSYFVSVYLLHLMVDFLLFIPRLAHKWMNAFTQGD